MGRYNRLAKAVDRSGMEALLPVGRWRGYGGPSDFNSTTFESFTWAAALGSRTKYVTVLATCHVPLVHPLMVAKMASTIDHVTNGRFALNVVCGWFKNEFDMFGADMRPHDDRYKYATEWLQFLKQAWTDDAEFDFESDNFHARNVWSQPKPLQNRIAGHERGRLDSRAGIHHAPLRYEFCHPQGPYLSRGRAEADCPSQDDGAIARARDAHLDPRLCRLPRTEKEAKDYLHRYVYEQGDWEAAGNLLRSSHADRNLGPQDTGRP